MKKTIIAVSIMSLLSVPVMADLHEQGVIDYQGKPATQSTIDANAAHAATLNFADKAAFERANKNLIAAFDDETNAILRDKFTFIGDETPNEVNPSLYRQAQLNQTAAGLYKVTDGIYQIRGTDLSNLTFIKGDTGWIVYDVLLTKEAAAQSIKFAFEHLPEGQDLPIVAMIYSHSHADHFGGARAIQDLYPDVAIYGPNNVTKETIDENVLAGNAMSRRAAYQYGATLSTSEKGIVDAALGKGLSKGEVTYVKPTYTLNANDTLETLTIDGLEMIFLDVPGAEAPAEMVTYIPSKKALWTGELTYQGMHNIYTLRGAKVRDSLAWSKYLNEMVTLWGEDTTTLFAAHSAPIWGNDEINAFLRLQRDNYGLVHNQTLRLANNGVTIQDIGDALQDNIPKTIYDAWNTNGYHGTYSHNAKAVYNMYLGYFDMNPANLNPLPTKQEAVKFVEYMGGAEATIKLAKADFAQGEYRFVATALNKVVMAEPSNQEARDLLADTYEQLGYQSEGAGWRNTYLSGAQELRIGIQPGAPKAASADVISEMDVPTLFDFLAVKVDALKAAKLGYLSLNVVVPDADQILYVELSNGNLNNIIVKEKKDADATLFINKADVTKILLGQTSLKSLLESKQAGMTGDQQAFAKIASTLVEFDANFEIVPLPVK